MRRVSVGDIVGAGSIGGASQASVTVLAGDANDVHFGGARPSLKVVTECTTAG